MRAKLLINLPGGPRMKRSIPSAMTIDRVKEIVGKYYNMSGEVIIVYQANDTSGHQYIDRPQIARGLGGDIWTAAYDSRSVETMEHLLQP